MSSFANFDFNFDFFLLFLFSYFSLFSFFCIKQFHKPCLPFQNESPSMPYPLHVLCYQILPVLCIPTRFWHVHYTQQHNTSCHSNWCPWWNTTNTYTTQRLKPSSIKIRWMRERGLNPLQLTVMVYVYRWPNRATKMNMPICSAMKDFALRDKFSNLGIYTTPITLTHFFLSIRILPVEVLHKYLYLSSSCWIKVNRISIQDFIQNAFHHAIT